MRKYFIDNLRSLCILLLFPYHTFMIYNDFGESFYIRGEAVPLFSGFIVICAPWFMPLLFVVAGISTRYALDKRNSKEYVLERFKRLFVPFIFGLLVLIPVQTYYAERFHNNFSGNYFEQYILFFSKWTDLTGYNGGFTPGHLWFILYLFLISLLALPVIILIKKRTLSFSPHPLTMLKILPMFILFLLASPILELGGKSFFEFFILFLLGYFVLSENDVQKRLARWRWPLLLALIVLLMIHLYLSGQIEYSSIPYHIYRRFVTWIGILALLGLSVQYLDMSNRLTKYSARAAFPIYILHQSVLVAVAYYVFKFSQNAYIQAGLILFLSLLFSILVYECVKRIPIMRSLMGIKMHRKRTSAK